MSVYIPTLCNVMFPRQSLYPRFLTLPAHLYPSTGGTVKPSFTEYLFKWWLWTPPWLQHLAVLSLCLWSLENLALSPFKIIFLWSLIYIPKVHISECITGWLLTNWTHLCNQHLSGEVCICIQPRMLGLSMAVPWTLSRQSHPIRPTCVLLADSLRWFAGPVGIPVVILTPSSGAPGLKQ